MADLNVIRRPPTETDVQAPTGSAGARMAPCHCRGCGVSAFAPCGLSHLRVAGFKYCVSGAVADFPFTTQDNKTALYWAVEKGNAAMVRDILQCGPDTEICTKVRPPARASPWPSWPGVGGTLVSR